MRFADIGERGEAPVRAHGLARTDLVRCAGAPGDFNPMHHDDGLGRFSPDLLATAISDWAGIGNIVRHRVRFTRRTWPGELLTSRIVVTGKRKDDGRQLVDLACEAGEVKVAGEATVVVP